MVSLKFDSTCFATNLSAIVVSTREAVETAAQAAIDLTDQLDSNRKKLRTGLDCEACCPSDNRYHKPNMMDEAISRISSPADSASAVFDAISAVFTDSPHPASTAKFSVAPSSTSTTL